MDELSSQVLRIDFSPKPEEQPETPEPSRTKPPPAHLNAATRRAWADIVGATKRLDDADEQRIEVAAVLLARLREGGPVDTLAERLNTLLIELGLPPHARAEIQAEETLAAYSWRRRAYDTPALTNPDGT